MNMASTSLEKSDFRLHLSCRGTRLQEIAQGLLSLASRSEDEFIGLGEKLMEFSSTSHQIFQQTELSLQKINGTGDDNVLVNIRRLLEASVVILHKQSDYMADSLHCMQPMSENLYQLSKLENDFQKINRFLRIIGICTKIESERVGVQGEEFMSLGKEIDRIWSLFTQNTDDLFQQAGKSAVFVDLAQKRMDGHHKNYVALISRLQESIQSALKGVEEMFQLSSMAGKKMADGAQHISQEIGKIVSSLQFHDITRQEIEHVHEALVEKGGRIKDSSALKDEKFFSLIQKTNQSLIIQIAQLENAAKQMDQAGTRIRTSLEEIAGKSEENKKIVSVFDGNISSGESGKMECLESEISKLDSILHQWKNLEEELSQVIKPTTQCADQIDNYMNQMEKVAYKVNILSLNALIKATRNVKSGRAFEVLAEEISQQAKYSGELSREASLKLHTLTQKNKDMAKTLGLFEEQKSKALSIVVLTRENAGGLHDLNREIVQTVHSLIGKNDRLASEIIQLAESIQFDNLFRTKVTRCLQELEEIQNEIQKFLYDNHEYLPEDPDANLDSLSNRYTMEKEREIHQEVIFSASTKGESEAGEEIPPQDEAGPEEVLEGNEGIFPQDEAEQGANEEIFPKDKVEQEESFGDNVELF